MFYNSSPVATSDLSTPSPTQWRWWWASLPCLICRNSRGFRARGQQSRLRLRQPTERPTKESIQVQCILPVRTVPQTLLCHSIGTSNYRCSLCLKTVWCFWPICSALYLYPTLALFSISPEGCIWGIWDKLREKQNPLQLMPAEHPWTEATPNGDAVGETIELLSSGKGTNGKKEHRWAKEEGGLEGSGQTYVVSYEPFVRTFVKLFVQMFVWEIVHYSSYKECSFTAEYSLFYRIFGHFTEYLVIINPF